MARALYGVLLLASLGLYPGQSATYKIPKDLLAPGVDPNDVEIPQFLQELVEAKRIEINEKNPNRPPIPLPQRDNRGRNPNRRTNIFSEDEDSSDETKAGDESNVDADRSLKFVSQAEIEREEKKRKLKEQRRKERALAEADPKRWMAEDNLKTEETRKQEEYHNYVNSLPETKFVEKGGAEPRRRKRIVYKNRGITPKDFDWHPDEDTYNDAYIPYGFTEYKGIRSIKSLLDLKKQRLMVMSNATNEAKQHLQREIVQDENEGQAAAHWSAKSLPDMEDRDWRILKEDYRIAYKGTIWHGNPIRSWEESFLPKPILKAVDSLSYERPTAIQMAAVPIGQTSRDVIGVASTGSGKTCGFVVPMLLHIMSLPKITPLTSDDGPYGLILAPTRELAMQIEEEAKQLAKFTGIRILSVVGGAGMETQGSLIRKGVEIVIATPGRAQDMIERQQLVLNQCNFVVLDEADRMVGLGFDDQIQAILSTMGFSNEKATPIGDRLLYRKTYMFSATMPRKIEALARNYMRMPVMVQVGDPGAISQDIHQSVTFLADHDDDVEEVRTKKLGEVLKEHFRKDSRQVMVFVNRKDDADLLLKQVGKWHRRGNSGLGSNIRAETLHSGKTQGARRSVIEAFRAKRFQILIATDVLGRGIDFKDIGLVVNYHMPSTIEHYTHRVGRTGRAGKKGRAVSFLTTADKAIFPDLKALLRESHAFVPYELENEAFDIAGRPVFFQ